MFFVWLVLKRTLRLVVIEFSRVIGLWREFILFSRLGRTDSSFVNLHDAGRMDIVHECVVASLFLSHGLRRDVDFHVVLNGSPNPPLHVQISGEELYDVRTDVDTWKQILKKVISGRPHPGISVDRMGFEALLKERAKVGRVFVLEEGGCVVSEAGLGLDERVVFVLGDHVGLPKKAELFALRFGEKLSLGKQPYLAASCITILNYLLDCLG